MCTKYKKVAKTAENCRPYSLWGRGMVSTAVSQVTCDQSRVKETISVYSGNDMKAISSHSGQNSELQIVKKGGIYIVIY
jgi:hypothetical protein